MSIYTTGARILALHRLMLTRTAAAVASGDAEALDVLRGAYAETMGHAAQKGGFDTLLARARVVAAWRSARPAPLARLAERGVSIPESLMSAEQRAAHALRAYHVERRARDYAIDELGDTRRARLPLTPTAAALAERDPLPRGAMSRDALAALGLDLPGPDALDPPALEALADALEAAQAQEVTYAAAAD